MASRSAARADATSARRRRRRGSRAARRNVGEGSQRPPRAARTRTARRWDGPDRDRRAAPRCSCHGSNSEPGMYPCSRSERSRTSIICTDRSFRARSGSRSSSSRSICSTGRSSRRHSVMPPPRNLPNRLIPTAVVSASSKCVATVVRRRNDGRLLGLRSGGPSAADLRIAPCGSRSALHVDQRAAVRRYVATACSEGRDLP